MITELTQQNFETETTNTDNFVLIDFWAEWCGPCQMLSPIIKEISEERNDIKVCKVNVDEQMALAQQFRVVSIPMLIIMHNGKVVQKTIGYQEKDDILALIHD
jgi:thioredoxin 1